MNHMLIMLVMICGFLMLGCDAAQVSKTPQRRVKEKAAIEGQSTEELAGKKSSDQDKEEESSESQADVGEESIELETVKETPAPEVDGESEDEPVVEEKRTSIALTSMRREDDDISVQVRLPEGEWKNVDWPEPSLTALVDGICLDGKPTEIEMQIIHPGRGTIATAGSEIGLRKTGENSLEVGYESQGGCTGAGCQDDNIILLACPSEIKVKGLK